MTAPLYPDVTAYSYALFGALCSVGIEPKQALDCARNVAGPLAQLEDVDTHEAIVARLVLQRGFGLTVEDLRILAAADACCRVPRFVEAPVVVQGEPRGSRVTDEADPNYGRCCGLCGAAIRAFERYAHAEVCPQIFTSPKRSLHARFTSLPADERAGTSGFRKLAAMNGGGR